MTNAEAAQLVNTEIRTRYKTLNDTQFGDWVYAFQYHSVWFATQIVHDLVQHPDLTLTLKAFKKLAWERRHKQTVQSKELPGYDAWIRCIEAPADHPTWEGREWCAHVKNFRPNNRANQEYVMQCAADYAHDLQTQEGGRWAGVCKILDNTLYAGPLSQHQLAEQAIDRILDGPDSPSREVALTLRANGKTVIDLIHDALKPIPREPGQDG